MLQALKRFAPALMVMAIPGAVWAAGAAAQAAEACCCCPGCC